MFSLSRPQLALLIALATLLGSSVLQADPVALPNLESINHTPVAFAYEVDPALSDLFGKGLVNLCWPAAVAEAIAYQRNERVPAFSRLQPPPVRSGGMPDEIREFARLCKTDPNGGTGIADGVRCISDYYAASGYTPQVEVIGVWFMGLDQIAPAMFVNRGHQISDFRTALKEDRGMILTAGFYVFDAVHKTWTRTFGHAVTVTGYDYEPSWPDGKITLNVVNSAVKYAAKPPARGFDKVEVAAFDNPYPAVPPPPNAHLTIKGSTFTTPGGVFLIEDLVIFSPGGIKTAGNP
jgi:hypothetical protein